MTVWTGHIWIRIRISETYRWQCGLDISGLGQKSLRYCSYSTVKIWAL